MRKQRKTEGIREWNEGKRGSGERVLRGGIEEGRRRVEKNLEALSLEVRE